MRFMFAFVFVIMATMAAFSVNVSAATFVVNTTNDTQDAAPGNGTCADAQGQCSLRAAISEANALAGADTITVPAGTYTQSLVGANENANAGGDWDITSSLTINGAGAATTIIQANAASGVATERVFHVVNDGTTVTIDGVTIQNGWAKSAADGQGRGGGIKVAGDTTTSGVGILFTLTNSVVKDNRADTRGGGLAINKGNLVVTGCTFSGNNAGDATQTVAGGSGGAMVIDSQDNALSPSQTAVITNTIMTGNKAETALASSFGGAIIMRAVGATVTLDGCTVTNNTSISTPPQVTNRGFAGGLYNQNAHMIVRNSVVTGNTSSDFHAGIRSLNSPIVGEADTTLDIINSTISNNIAQGTNVTTGGQGGGVAQLTAATSVLSSTVNLDHSTISGNAATAGIAGGILNTSGGTGAVLLNITNSTISGNSASDIGGIYSDGTSCTTLIDFSTVANNSATGATGEGGGIYQDTTAGGSTLVSNSISADNTAVTSVDINDVATSLDYNHFENPNAAFVGAAHDVLSGDPVLGALANNGGLTKTHLPSNNSVIVNTIPNGTGGCGNPVSTDQRGFQRPVGSGCEKGAVEIDPEGPTPTATNTFTPTATVTPTGTPPVTAALPNVSASPGTVITVPVTVGDTTGRGIISYDLQVSFNPAVIVPASPEFDATGTLSNTMSVTPNGNNAGHLIISAFQAANLSGAGTLINLKFNVVGALGSSTALTFADYTDPNQIPHPGFLWNEGDPPAAITNGSVTVGNVTPTATPTVTATPSGTPPVSAALPNISASPGTVITVPVTVGDTTGRGIISYDFQVSFNPAVIVPASPEFDATGTLSSTMSITPNGNNAGHLIISAFQAANLSGAGVLINLKFNVVGELGSSTALTFADYTDPNQIPHPGFLWNEGDPPALTTNGSVTVGNVTPTATSTPTLTSTATPANTATSTRTPTNTPTPVGGPTPFTITPNSRDFGSVAIRTTSSPVRFLIRNVSGITAFGMNYTFSGTDGNSFRMSLVTCGSTLSAGSSCNLDVTFTPSTIGPKTATLNVFSQSTTNSVSAVLTGTAIAKSLFDYDFDGRSDISVFRPSTTEWYLQRSTIAGPFGLFYGVPNDKPVPADYDGDGKQISPSIARRRAMGYLQQLIVNL